jgi:hypothetical protein
MTKAADRLSRRELLRRLAVGTAAVWTTPTLLSFGSASAQPTGPRTRCPLPCKQFQTCFDDPDPKNQCFCATSAEGECVCLANGLCSAAHDCVTSADCRPGYVCAPNTGCGPAGICARGCRRKTSLLGPL